MIQDVVIVGARRTAVGSFNGSFSGLPAHELGAEVIKSLLADTPKFMGQGNPKLDKTGQALLDIHETSDKPNHIFTM